MNLKKRKYKIPSGWNANNYWSASLSSSGHAYVYLFNGNVFNNDDTFSKYVAFEVL